jgi:hypothetical protein
VFQLAVEGHLGGDTEASGFGGGSNVMVMLAVGDI